MNRATTTTTKAAITTKAATSGATPTPPGRARTIGAVLDRSSAVEWATWFDALGDPTRVQILHLLSTSDAPMAVGEITDRLDVGQSTVSHHLSKLAAVRFVLVERVGTASYWKVNDACLRSFPSVAEVVMGRVDRSFLDAMEECDD